MIRKNNNSIYTFDELSQLGIIHGFSTVPLGNMVNASGKSVTQTKTLTDALHIVPTSVIGMDQVHGDTIEQVTISDCETIITKTDGLLTSDANIFLYGTFADCVPVLLFDKKSRMLGIIHAGWRGVYAEIVGKAIGKMLEKGSDPKNIIAAIGPSIRSCCYEVSEDLAKKFADKFGKRDEYILQRNGNYFLDLQVLVKQQLLAKHIVYEHIFDAMICTKDNPSDFFSYRRNGQKEGMQVFAAIIGRLN